MPERFASVFTLGYLVATLLWAFAAGGLATFAALGGDSQVAVLWGALLGSVGISGLGIVWKAWDRLRRILERVVDLGFDRVEKRLGMEPTDMDGTFLPSPMDDLMKDEQ